MTISSICPRQQSHRPMAPAASLSPILFLLLLLFDASLIRGTPALAASAQPAGKQVINAPPPVNLTTLTSAHAAHSLSQAEASRAYPVHLHAMVTYYENTLDPGSPRFFAMDSSGSIYIALITAPAFTLVSGDLVEITGVTGPGQFAPIVDHAQVRLLGRSHLPAKVSRATATSMMDGATDGQWVEVEGVVHAFRRYERQIFLDLWMADGVLTAFTVFDPAVDYSRLVDATVAIRGNAAPLFNAMGQMTGAHIIFPGMATLTIEQSAPADPFHLTISRISDLLRFTPHSELQHRAHIRGSLTLLWPGRMICVQDGSKDLCADTLQTDPVRIGQIVDVLGFPSIGEFNPTLDHAIYRPRQAFREPVASSLTFDQALNPSSDARLITVEGRLINENRAGEMPSITLSSGDNVFTAVLPKSLLPDTVRMLQYGTTFRVTGVCRIHSDGEGNTLGSTPTAKSFTIMERSVADLVLVERPSWWNAAHTLAVLAIALAITAIAFCWLVVLRRRVKQQTATIRSQLKETHALKEAAEFQATHDGLTGLYNRKAIFDMLQREFAAADRTGDKTGIIMLDLDHFKKINDNFGHAAGDDVIREAVRRILSVVRATDWVGRYGGEEFLIVIPKCDFPDVQMCADRIRCAISDGYIATHDHTLPVTASLGSTVASFPRHSTQEAVTAADLALYDAKHNGRNRVAFRQIESRQNESQRPPPADTPPAVGLASPNLLPNR